MMSMREKIARAIYHSTPRNKPWDVLKPEFQRQYGKQADAVLDALMEPTKGMCLAVEDLIEDCMDHDYDSDIEGNRYPYSTVRAGTESKVFIAMIKAAKEGK